MSEIVMPRLSDTMEEGTILRWLKHDGEHVARGEELVEIETDKAAMTYESDSEGILQTVAREGDTLAVGEPIARVGEAASEATRRRSPCQPTDDSRTAGTARRRSRCTDGTAGCREPTDRRVEPGRAATASASRHLRSPGGSRARRAWTSARSPAADPVGASSRPTWRPRGRAHAPPALRRRPTTAAQRPRPPRRAATRAGAPLRSRTCERQGRDDHRRAVAHAAHDRQTHGRVQGDDPRLHADAPTSTWSAA